MIFYTLVNKSYIKVRFLSLFGDNTINIIINKKYIKGCIRSPFLLVIRTIHR